MLYGRARSPAFFPRSAFWLSFCFFLPIVPVDAQDETGYRTGKTYVIRLSPSAPDQAMLETAVLPWMQEQFDKAGGMLGHIRDKIYPVRSMKDQSWYYVYFDPTRQAKDVLFQDNDLLVWFFHGHHVIIQPIEALVSPSVSLPLNAGMIQERR
jgi:hypothetical protein